MLKKITIFIPTQNRHNYLKRILDYYANINLNIMVFDSSDNIFRERKDYNIEYYYSKNCTFIKKLNESVKKVKTKYVAMCADDDFFMPNGIKKCISFLEKNKDYVSVQGCYTSFTNNRKVSFQPAYLFSLNLDVNSNLPSRRLKQQFSLYMHQSYSVHRTKNLQEIYELAQKNNIINYNLLELLVVSISSINGKHKVLPVFYYMRESMKYSAGKTCKTLREIILEQNKLEYETFKRIIIDHLSKKQMIPITKSKNVFEKAIDIYLNKINHRKVSKIKKIMKLLLGPKIGEPLYNLLNKMMAEFVRYIRIMKTINLKGYPFFDRKAKKELMKATYYIKKHNIQAR